MAKGGLGGGCKDTEGVRLNESDQLPAGDTVGGGIVGTEGGRVVEEKVHRLFACRKYEKGGMGKGRYYNAHKGKW